jgi:hypothetical protein
VHGTAELVTKIQKKGGVHYMKTLAMVVLTLVFGLMLAAPVSSALYGDDLARALATSTSGVFKSLAVVSCDAAKNTCVAKTAKEGNQTADMTYAQYNGGFNAAKELKAGDKISGQWRKVEGKYYITFMVKD